MAVIGARPLTGVRLDVERPHGEGPPWRYQGKLETPDAEIAIAATITSEGEVAVETAAPEDAAEKARLILRTAWKHADGEAPPRRIQRWRGEK
jgi:hypothetical protein